MACSDKHLHNYWVNGRCVLGISLACLPSCIVKSAYLLANIGLAYRA